MLEWMNPSTKISNKFTKISQVEWGSYIVNKQEISLDSLNAPSLHHVTRHYYAAISSRESSLNLQIQTQNQVLKLEFKFWSCLS